MLIKWVLQIKFKKFTLSTKNGMCCKTIMFRMKIRQSPFYFWLWPRLLSVTPSYYLHLPFHSGGSETCAVWDRTSGPCLYIFRRCAFPCRDCACYHVNIWQSLPQGENVLVLREWSTNEGLSEIECCAFLLSSYFYRAQALAWLVTACPRKSL